MFRNRKLFNMLLVLGLIAGILTSCAQPTPEPTQAPVEPTQAPVEPRRTG